MGACASAPATLPSVAGPAVWAPAPSRTSTADGAAPAPPDATASSAAALSSWSVDGQVSHPARSAVDPAAPLTQAVRAPAPRPAPASAASTPRKAAAAAPTAARTRSLPAASRPPPPPPALGALVDEDEDVAPGALTPGRVHDRPTGPPPTMLQAPVDALPPAAGLAYAAPYIPPPGPPRPASPGPRTPADAAAAAADAAWRPARRRAVLVACCYRGAEALDGGAAPPSSSGGGGSDPVGDAAAVRTLLATKFGFGPGDTVFLSDGQPHPRLRPTKANVLAAAAWLVGGAGPADSLVFAFFGRGAGPGGAPVGWVEGGEAADAVAAACLPRSPARPPPESDASDDDAENDAENEPPPPSTTAATPDAVTACSSPVKGSVVGSGEAEEAEAAAAAAAAAASLAAFFGRPAAPLSPVQSAAPAAASTPPATPPPAPGVASPTLQPPRAVGRGAAAAQPTATSQVSLASSAGGGPLAASTAGPLAAATTAPPAASSGAAGVGYCAALAPCDWRSGKSLTPADLHAALIAPLPKGARLLAAIDAAGGRFSLGLPAAAAVRPDGWPAWAAAGSRAVGAPAPGAGEAVLIASDYEAAPADAAAQGGAIAYALVQAVEQGHTGSWAALVRALRYATRNGGPGFGPGTRPPAVTASRRFDFNRPFLI